MKEASYCHLDMRKKKEHIILIEEGDEKTYIHDTEETEARGGKKLCASRFRMGCIMQEHYYLNNHEGHPHHRHPRRPR